MTAATQQSPERFTPQGGFTLKLPGSQPVQVVLFILFLACARVQEEEQSFYLPPSLSSTCWSSCCEVMTGGVSNFVCIVGLEVGGEKRPCIQSSSGQFVFDGSSECVSLSSPVALETWMCRQVYRLTIEFVS